jgi:tetratricopeptide (TPR) repeat protein
MRKQTDFEAELGWIERDLSELAGNGRDPHADSESATRFAYLLYKRGSLTGDLAELERASTAVELAVSRVANPADLYFLKANLDFKFHRLADVRRDLEASAELRHSPQGRALRADLDFQEGRYEEARAGYESLAGEDPTWDDFARLAHFNFKLGDGSSAERLYEQAEDELTAKEMRHFAWVELQRGLLDLSRGRYDDAQSHYERAERAYSGHWQVEEHMAELLGARGRFDEALALYLKVVERVPRPEFMQALGELYEFVGLPEGAQPWYERALDAYLESARRGGVHYYHHLADFYSDVREDGAEAVRWASEDMALRENFSTQAALAWALYRDGQHDAARELMDRSLSSGVTDARLFSQAAAIYQAAGDVEEAERRRRMATKINPYHHNFHVHR